MLIPPECIRLPGVLHVVLDVAHFVVDRDEIVHVDHRAHLDAEVVGAEEIPGTRMAHDRAIGRLFENGFCNQFESP